MNDPDLSAFVRALRVTHPMHAHIQPTTDEAEVADLIEELDAIHVRDWAMCGGCAEQWPCRGRLHAEELGLLWMGRAQARYTAHARAMVERLEGRAGEGQVARRASALLPRPVRTPAVLPAEAETERARLAAARAIPVSSVHCRFPGCRTTVSVPHPLEPGYLDGAVCDRHRDTTESRYVPGPWLSETAGAVPRAVESGRCASCSGPISSSAEWCCEPCATGSGHADTCKVRSAA